MPVPWLCRFPSLRRSLNLSKFPISVFFSTSTPKISVSDYLLNHHRLSPNRASSTTDFAINPENADSVLNFLKESGFTNNQIESLVQKLPRVLSYNLETCLEPKINVFKELGFLPADLAAFISSCPWHLKSSAEWLQQSILALKNTLGPNADICSFFRNSRYWLVIRRNLDTTLVPNVVYLKSCGICPLQITTHACKYPDFYRFNPEKFKELVERVDEMGVNRESKVFLHALRVMSKMTRKNLELKLKLFRDIGFSEQNILHAFRTTPFVFFASVRKIKEVKGLLLSVVDTSYIASHPQFFTYGVEKRLKPRLRLLKTLESKNLLMERPVLSAFCRLSDAKFTEKYVIPYSDEIRDLYVATNGSDPIAYALLTEKS